MPTNSEYNKSIKRNELIYLIGSATPQLESANIERRYKSRNLTDKGSEIVLLSNATFQKQKKKNIKIKKFANPKYTQ